MKKAVLGLWAFLLVAVLLTAVATPHLFEEDRAISVHLNGNPVSFDVQPVVVNDRTMVPVRAVLEAMGATVSWQSATNAVYAETLHHGQLRHVIGTQVFTLDGITHNMDNPSISRQERTLVPIRFFAEALGHSVAWSDSIWGVVISAQVPPTGVLGLNNMEFSLQNTAGITVHNFDFGDAGMLNIIGDPIPAPLTGIVAVPSGTGTHPLVFIMHGMMPVSSVHDPVYAGFDYLVRQLAAEGYVAVSVNVNIEYSIDFGESAAGDWGYQLFELYLENLARANAGESLISGVNLQNRIDFSEIHLLGHSRGGELADIFARRDDEAGISRIASLLRIATQVIPYREEWGDAPHPDIPVAILLPEFDGDVDNFGQLVFDEVKEQAQNDSVLSLVYLRGANHNYFNRAMTPDDGRFQVNRLTRAQQEDFLMRYSAAFLAYVRGERAAWGIFDPSVPQPRTMFGMQVIASTYVSGKQSAIAMPTAESVNALNTVGGAKANFHVQTFGADGGLFNHPGVLSRHNQQLPLYQITWQGQGGVTFPTSVSNFSGRTALSLYLSSDPTNEANVTGQNQAITLTLIDHTGASSEVAVPMGTPALTWHHGELVEGFFGDFWNGFTPLGELRIPLSLFEGLDLTNVVSIRINLGNTPSGSIMLSGAYLL